ncbi:hypothetical protein TEA_013846 [Camellia sinensis var. sinensis]|uniref:Uncharacterized protein n=1 Tax=Camellia sinensis var. sinensis TaxID=542762 RepID=A0A4S4EFN6_CAMSN|nr:hypothetical protein TEA_013846 [Camellia sinensis var. sinensis]
MDGVHWTKVIEHGTINMELLSVFEVLEGLKKFRRLSIDPSVELLLLIITEPVLEGMFIGIMLTDNSTYYVLHSYVICITMTQYLINLIAASVEMDFILQLDLIGLSFFNRNSSNLLRIFSNGVGSEEGITMEASKNPCRKPHLQAASRARRSSLSNLTRAFYRQGHENSSSGSTDFSCNLNSKLLHLAWHPRTNLIACGAGNSLLLYYA